MERFLGLPLDTKTIPQAVLNIANKERSNLFPWNGQFSPQLVETLLTAFAKECNTVLDPFMGSGTVIHEAAKRGLEVFGVDINPAAMKMAQTYRLMGLPYENRRRLVDGVSDQLDEALPDQSSLFAQADRHSLGDVKTAVLALRHEATCEWAQLIIEALIILLDFYKDCTAEKVDRIWQRLKSTILELEHRPQPIHISHGDARKLPVPDHSIDFVLTSPPYINVFNYHQQYRRSAEAIGWNLLRVAKAEIGSNRKHRSNRLYTVVQYCLDLAQALREIARVCRDNACVIVVIGRESNVRKTQFYNGDIVANLAVRSLGWSLFRRQERDFMNRFGNTIVEDILHFAVSKHEAAGVEPREIAREVMIEARSRVPAEVRADLEDVLSNLATVKPSPLFDPAAACTAIVTRR